jgi:hypothetical protein
MYVNATLLCVGVIIFVVETQQRFLCVFELHVAVDYIKILGVTQQYFYDKFMSLLTINHNGSSCKVSDVARKQKHFAFAHSLLLSCVARLAV